MSETLELQQVICPSCKQVITSFSPFQAEVECPYCHSINTKKITNSSKAVHTALFGVFSLSRNSKQFHCNNCKADF